MSKKIKGRMILKDVSVQVQKGEIVGLLGPNGAGKTSCFYALCGLSRLTKGRVLIQGIDVSKFPMYARARLGMGYLPQESSIFRGLNVEKNILAVLEFIEANRAERRSRLESLLKAFGLTSLRKSPSVALSGGERRRLELARALASRPQYMLLDEPFAGVDPLAVQDFQSLILRLKIQNLGVMITDHNVKETLRIVDRAYILYNGEIFAEGTPEDLMQNQELKAIYFGESLSGIDKGTLRKEAP